MCRCVRVGVCEREYGRGEGRERSGEEERVGKRRRGERGGRRESGKVVCVQRKIIIFGIFTHK